MAEAVLSGDSNLMPEQRLVFARSLGERQQHGDALLAYYRASIEAQRQGRWLDKATTVPALVGRVAHAMRYVKAGRRRATPSDPRQQPPMLYFPGLPAAPYFERSALPWIETLERQTDAASWNGFYFFRQGERRGENHALCPRTSAALEALPLVRIRANAPEVMFSVLTPGSHILPHHGVTNARAVCHLPLLVPEDCALVVGGERRAWREGEAFVFDDTYEHEAWNRNRAVAA